MATKKKAAKAQKPKCQQSPPYYESDASRLTRLRYDVYREFVGYNNRPGGFLSDADAMKYAKDAKVVASILFEGQQ